MASPSETDTLPQRMRAGLVDARRRGDRVAVSALRTALAAMANAEAPPSPVPESAPASAEDRFPAEVPRLELDDAQLRAVVASEIADRADTIATYRDRGRTAEADELSQQVRVLQSYLA